MLAFGKQWEETVIEIAHVKYFEWGTVRGAEKRAILGLEENSRPVSMFTGEDILPPIEAARSHEPRDSPGRLA